MNLMKKSLFICLISNVTWIQLSVNRCSECTTCKKLYGNICIVFNKKWKCNLSNYVLFAVSESLEDMKGVLAGGVIQGWTPDVAVGLWRRMLGTLGGINKIEDAENHALVFEELSLLIETMNKVLHPVNSSV